MPVPDGCIIGGQIRRGTTSSERVEEATLGIPTDSSFRVVWGKKGGVSIECMPPPEKSCSPGYERTAHAKKDMTMPGLLVIPSIGSPCSPL